MKTANNSELDKFDKAIIKTLSIDGRMSITDLAKTIGLSQTPTQQRLKRLIDLNYITGFRAIPNPSMLDMEYITFVEVRLLDTREHALETFNNEVLKIPEIEECHMVASRFDYLLKVRTQNIKKYRIVLAEKISNLPFVAGTSSIVSMETVKDISL